MLGCIVGFINKLKSVKLNIKNMKLIHKTGIFTKEILKFKFNFQRYFSKPMKCLIQDSENNL